MKVCPRFEIDSLRAWYYHISLNSRTLVILLQVDFVSNGELKIIYGGFYKTENISIFTWFSIFGIRHYCWLRNPIHRLPLNNKVDYLVRTIHHIPSFIQL